MMSAGTGIVHSEFNASQTEAVHLFRFGFCQQYENTKSSTRFAVVVVARSYCCIEGTGMFALGREHRRPAEYEHTPSCASSSSYASTSNVSTSPVRPHQPRPLPGRGDRARRERVRTGRITGRAIRMSQAPAGSARIVKLLRERRRDVKRFTMPNSPAAVHPRGWMSEPAP